MIASLPPRSRQSLDLLENAAIVTPGFDRCDIHDRTSDIAALISINRAYAAQIRS
jgi:hypothetical protein